MNEDDTLAEWLYQRFTVQITLWEDLDEDHKDYWKHEANAVRRAVARGGFKEGDGQEDGTRG